MLTMKENKRNSILIMYHFYKPDDVISAHLFTELAEGLAQKGWDVTVYTSNRYCTRPNETITEKQETINNVKIIRFSRWGLNQGKNISRLINSAIISTKWLINILFAKNYDIILMGTDPQLGYFIMPYIRLFKPKTKLAVWEFDLYPEILGQMRLPAAVRLCIKLIIEPWARLSFSCLDIIADLGSCMKKRLAKYKSKASRPTLIPWAISEPNEILEPDAEVREKLFGDAKIGILYSGTIGHAHEFEDFIALARELRSRKAPISFCFAGRGNKYAQLINMVREEDTNITIAGFADETELALRLTAADMHMISLKQGWEGLVVPSKFFGSLATGRPLIYAGTPDSAIKEWIETYEIGFYLDSSNIKEIADKLCVYIETPDSLPDLQKRTFGTWQQHFAREIILDKFEDELSKVIER